SLRRRSNHVSRLSNFPARLQNGYGADRDSGAVGAFAGIAARKEEEARSGQDDKRRAEGAGRHQQAGVAGTAKSSAHSLHELFRGNEARVHDRGQEAQEELDGSPGGRTNARRNTPQQKVSMSDARTLWHGC